MLHAVNLFLEIFGQCTVLSENLDEIIVAPVRRVNWDILPAGRRPWDKLKPFIEKILKQAPEGRQPVIDYRLQMINRYGPEFVAVGRAGFHGYLIFGFPTKNLYLLESAYTGNATYVFAENWEKLSQLTKAEILTGKLQKDRLIHREGWETRVKRLLS